jgi:alpha-glucosidase (family GH31 glycosyl hydrolase)
VKNAATINSAHSPVARSSVVSNGNIAATVTDTGVTVTRVSDGVELFHTMSITAAGTSHAGYYAWNLTVRSTTDEKLWGLGERMTSQLNNKGLNIDFRADQTNTVCMTCMNILPCVYDVHEHPAMCV